MSCRVVLLSGFVLGCGPAVTTDESGDLTAADGDTGTTTADATATTAGTTAATTATTAMTTVGTTTEPAGCATDFVTGCQSNCAAAVTCNPGDPELGTFEECVMQCTAELIELPPACQQAWCEALACTGTLDCKSLKIGTAECDALFAATDEACAGDDCFVGAGADGMCEYGCNGGVELRLRCDASVCVCFEDDIETASCPADGICNALDGLDDYGAACCGW